MAIPEFALFLFGLLQRVVCRCVWGESESFSFPLPLLLTSQLDGGSRVLGGLESKERIMGGERERKCLEHFLLGSSQSSPVAWDATTRLNQSRKQHPGCIKRDQDPTQRGFSCKFHTSCFGFFCSQLDFWLLQLRCLDPMAIIGLFPYLM